MAVRKYQDQLKNKKKRRRLWLFLLLAGVVFLFLAGVVYCLFFARLFDYRTVSFNGPETESTQMFKLATEEWLGEKYLFIPHRDNSFVFPIDKWIVEWAKSQPEISQIKVEKKSVHEFLITYNLRQPVGVWCLTRPNQCYYFDENGLVYAETGPSEGFILTRIDDEKSDAIKMGEALISTERLQKILNAKELMTKEEIKIAKIVITGDSYGDYQLITQAGWKILLAFDINENNQLNAALNFYKNKLTDEQKINLQYIDLRIKDRIYYK